MGPPAAVVQHCGCVTPHLPRKPLRARHAALYEPPVRNRSPRCHKCMRVSAKFCSCLPSSSHRMHSYAVAFGLARSYQGMQGGEPTDSPPLEHHKAWLGEQAHQTRRQGLREGSIGQLASPAVWARVRERTGREIDEAGKI